MHIEDKDLECLILWPKGTKGWNDDLVILKLLNSLCKTRGYGAIPQITAWIEQLWRDPSKKQDFEEQRQAHLKSLGWEDGFTYHWCHLAQCWESGDIKDCPKCNQG